tara:strand:- start:2683 stop:4338 length:1656 start_codon:yes stop_codon:yes gene_type:complete
MSNLKFNIDGKNISSSEIKSGKKDFSTFYKNYATKTKAFYQKKWFLGSTGLASLIIFASIAYNNPIENINLKDNTTSNATNISVSAQKTEILPFVNPPIDGINVPWEKLLVDAAKGGVVINNRGSKISFPKMAFVDSSGNEIKNGKIEIRYREFLDQIDQVVSGIPMTYDSAGITYQFISAGMIEIKGFLDNQEVAMASKKEIKVSIASTTSDTEYNLYQLKPQERNWKCLGKDKVVGSFKLHQIEIDDKKINAKLQKIPEYTKLKEKRINILSEINTIKAEKPKEPKEAIEDVPLVNFDFNKDDYPELSEYSKVLFQLGNGQKINADDASRIWNEVDIEQQNDQYKITFTETPTGYKATYIANPVYEGESYEEAKAIFNDKFNIYSKKIDAKRSVYKKLSTKISAVKNRISTDYINGHNTSINMVRRVFSVEEFGTYNCDKPIATRRFKTGKSPINQISYNSKAYFRESVFYVNANKNTYLNRYLVQSGTLYYRDRGDNFLIIVKGKEFGFINHVQFKAITDKVDGVFDFKDLKTASSLKDLKQQLKFNL